MKKGLESPQEEQSLPVCEKMVEVEEEGDGSWCNTSRPYHPGERPQPHHQDFGK